MDRPGPQGRSHGEETLLLIVGTSARLAEALGLDRAAAAGDGGHDGVPW